jgi:hypothetical protein
MLRLTDVRPQSLQARAFLWIVGGSLYSSAVVGEHILRRERERERERGRKRERGREGGREGERERERESERERARERV